MSVEETVKNVVAAKMGVRQSEVQRSTRLVEDLDADSLDHFELSLTLEEELDIPNIPDETIESFETVGGMIDHMETLVEEDHIETL